MTITIGYSPFYLKWTGSHASPQRAAIALAHLQARADDEQFELSVIQPSSAKFNLDQDRKRLKEIHDPSYIDSLYAGTYPGHPGEQGFVAALMFAGTRCLVQKIDASAEETGRMTPGVYFNPQGAKHHAAYAHSSGFCAINDMAWAAHHFTDKGLRVAYLDWDAHHGDGVEDLTRDNKNVLTASIHQWGIFPMTGRRSRPSKNVFNYPLSRGDGDAELVESVEDALELIADFEPDVLLMAIGADGHESDPLAGLNFTVNGFTEAASMVGKFLAERQIPVLIGGAGGYQPFTYVPLVWAEVVATIHEEVFGDGDEQFHEELFASEAAARIAAEDAADLGEALAFEMDDLLEQGVPDYEPRRTTSDRDRHRTQGYKGKGRR